MKFNEVHQETVKYVHHDKEVNVFAAHKGEHRLFCLCHNHCRFFKPELPPEENCPLAQENYEMCVRNNMTLPVFECPKYKSEYRGGL